MRQGLSLRVSQHLALTPQLQQSIRLLQLSTLELQQEVEQMLDDNPFLELATDEPVAADDGVMPATPSAATDSTGDDGAGESVTDERVELAEWSDDQATEGSLADTPQWDDANSPDIAPEAQEWDGDSAGPTRNAREDDDEADATTLAQSHETLQQHLRRQALSLRLDATDRAALHFLIESLNDDGYLEDSLEELAHTLDGGDLEAHDELVHRFTMALRLLQSMEPTGVGARGLAECLTLQLRALPASPGVSVAMQLCAQPLELMARRDFKRLAQLTGQPDASIRDAMSLIARLDPKPGRRFVDVERHVIVPDVIAVRSGRRGQARWRAQLNTDVMPRLRVHDLYAQALRQHKGEGGPALQQRLQEARWFIKNIQQRFDTILRVSNAIIERQKNFFIHGELAMRPLVLREIADELGLHESTISRVTTAKYLATPFGTFELKYFFGSSLSTETGGNASSTAVRALIRQFVAAEDAAKPLSDNQISDMLKEQGIECARRTVAKYREALRIAPANLRKAL